MKVSVLLPVYNAGEPLIQAIESILRQSFTEFDFLIIDDCSTDGSLDIISHFSKQSSKIRVLLHKQTQGIAATLNEGLNLLDSDFVIRMDQDDEALPHRLQTQVQYMVEHPEVVVAGSYVYHMGATPKFDRLVELPTDSESIRQTLRQYNCFYHPSVILRRREVLQIGGYRNEFKNAEDYDLWLRASKHFQLANIPEPLLRYRFSVSGATLSRKWEQLFYVYLALAAHQNDSKPLSEIEQLAAQQLLQTDKIFFLTEVAKGTINELIQLRKWIDALKVVSTFFNDVGEKTALRLLLKILRNYLNLSISPKLVRLK